MPRDMLELAAPAADERIRYGPEPLHFGVNGPPKLGKVVGDEIEVAINVEADRKK